MVRVLGIETSCDETAIGIVEEGTTVLANVLASSQAFHRPYGGVVPEIAARVHVEVIWQVLEEALEQANCRLTDLDAIAVTRGPGLPGALLIGLAFAKGLALSLDRPLVGVDHLAAHLYAGEMVDPTLIPPYVGLVVSGGHTLLCVAHADQRYELLGETKDDAVGEAFDKVARLLDLGYPGGPAIDRISDEGQPAAIAFPRSTAKNGCDFSFSGLKTAVYHYVKKLTQEMPQAAGRRLQEKSPEPGARSLERRQIADIAASFQEAAVDILVTKTLRACQRTGIRQLVVGGGVAANRRLRQRLTQEGQAHTLKVIVPPPALCLDNGVMVAGLAFALLRKGVRCALSLNADPNLHLG
jgi:N6-L-threonylcarbamoyladenine synthase